LLVLVVLDSSLSRRTSVTSLREEMTITVSFRSGHPSERDDSVSKAGIEPESRSSGEDQEFSRG
jgi:hypothetical protein